MQTFLTVEEARSLILKPLEPLPARASMLGDALGGILAAPTLARTDAPAFDNSSMDGFAVRWEDVRGVTDGTPASLDVIESIAAGSVPSQTLQAGQAARIMTGAPLPAGADTVIMRELCESLPSDRVAIQELPEAGKGAAIRARGAFIRAESTLLEAGTRLGPGDLALLASQSIASVAIAARPRVAILSTGDELVELGDSPGPGQIVNSNRVMLEALVRQVGAEPLPLPIVSDTREAVHRAFSRALETADLVISSGGVSVGDHDHVRDVLEELCQGIAFWKIRMKPGKPLAFGMDSRHATPLIGLPGNPASSFVCFHQFVRPALEVLQGVPAEKTMLSRVWAIPTVDIPSTPRRRQYVTGRLGAPTEPGGLPSFSPAPLQNSGNLTILGDIDALAIIEEGESLAPDSTSILVEIL